MDSNRPDGWRPDNTSVPKPEQKYTASNTERDHHMPVLSTLELDYEETLTEMFIITGNIEKSMAQLHSDPSGILSKAIDTTMQIVDNDVLSPGDWVSTIRNKNKRLGELRSRLEYIRVQLDKLI